MEKEICVQCGERLPVHNQKCEACLTGPELEAYADEYCKEDDEEILHFSGPPCGG